MYERRREREREGASERERARVGQRRYVRSLPLSLGRTAARAAWPVTSEDFLGIAAAAADAADADERTIRASSRGHGQLVTILYYVVNVISIFELESSFNCISMQFGKSYRDRECNGSSSRKHELSHQVSARRRVGKRM